MGVPNTVLSIKWGTAFGAFDVNMLFRACLAHTPNDLKFVCLTDDASGLDPRIDARPIPDIALTPEEAKRPGVWRKLSLFSPDIADLGRVLFLDLDMLVVGDLSRFFEVSEGAVFQNMGESWRPEPRSDEKITGTCIFSFDTSGESSVLDAFLARKEANMNSWNNEQEFVGAHVSHASYWPEGMVVSFKRHLCHRNGMGLFAKPALPLPSASIVAFHGRPRPSDTREMTLWGTFPHLHLGPVPWIENYYRRFG
ncbi:hypothetical protein [Silicimonas algicola]|uniref:Glycosyl transferase family 8 n=1 Tax=Silicimonas algicola TaxID=1826607 RepID=A0A316FXB4_9RHOB|nr:hypothetical protein [Silicimonas algicola]PWK52765.1 hypothetical protein C8D95_11542 [Silicimonas algicola]